MTVELEPGVWISDGEGDPPRTLDESKAKWFLSAEDARKALTEARKYKPFIGAIIVEEW